MSNFCKSVLRAKKGAKIIPNPPRMIVSGCGGTGKSHLIKAISKWAEKISMKPHCKYLHLQYISTTTLEMYASSGSGVGLQDVVHYISSTSISRSADVL